MANYYALLAISWNLLAGYTGQLSFGHTGLLAIGGYGSVYFVMLTGLPPALGMIVGSVLATLTGLGLGWICLRLKGIYLALTTFAFSAIIMLLLLSEYKVTGGRAGIRTKFLLYEPPYTIGLYYYFIGLAILALCLITTRWLIRSKYGLFFEAIREDEDAAAIYGLNIVRLKLLAFVISSFWVGLAGGFYAHLIGYISPAVADLSIMAMILTMTILGGLGSLFGPLIGGLVVWPLLEFIRSYSATLQQLIFAFAIIISLKFFRNGFIGLINSAIERYRKSQVTS